MRSDKITKGIAAAPQRALLHALGVTDQELGKPLIGIVSSYNEIVPGHMNLDKIAAAVKQGCKPEGFRLFFLQLQFVMGLLWDTRA